MSGLKHNVCIFITVIFLGVSSVYGESVNSCGCHDVNHCNLVNKWNTEEKKVVVTTDLTSKSTDWLWDTLTTVLVVNTSVENQTDLMCYTHSQGKQYGFFLDVPGLTGVTDTDIDHFISQSIQNVTTMHADVVALNFLQLVGDCGLAREHKSAISDRVTLVFHRMRESLLNVTILCVLPWKPPCYDSDCDITPLMASRCDGLILNLDSFSTYCEESCTAKAIVPYAKLMLAINEYISMGFKVSQMLISIPWHGYKYACTESDHLDGIEKYHICHLKSVTEDNQTVCQYEESRSKVNLGTLIKDHPDLAHQDQTYSLGDQSAWYTVQNGDNTSSLIWFEDIYSLETKYALINRFSLKGIVVYTADDLSNTHLPTDGRHGFDEFMWSWLIHQVFATKTPTAEPDDDKLNYTGIAVGIGVGMFLFGTLAGLVISCVISKQWGSKRYRSFGGEVDDDEFHDEL